MGDLPYLISRLTIKPSNQDNLALANIDIDKDNLEIDTCGGALLQRCQGGFTEEKKSFQKIGAEYQ